VLCLTIEKVPLFLNKDIEGYGYVTKYHLNRVNGLPSRKPFQKDYW
jgi:hypothetical protein